MPQIQLIVFDMAGTTVRDDNEVLHCFSEAAQKTGLVAAEDRVNAMMGLPKKVVFQTLWADQLGANHPDHGARVEASYDCFRQVLEHHYRTQPVEPTEGCVALFDWLRARGIAIALTTGFYREVTDIILGRLGWEAGRRDPVYGSACASVVACGRRGPRGPPAASCLRLWVRLRADACGRVQRGALARQL